MIIYFQNLNEETRSLIFNEIKERIRSELDDETVSDEILDEMTDNLINRTNFGVKLTYGEE